MKELLDFTDALEDYLRAELAYIEAHTWPGPSGPDFGETSFTQKCKATEDFEAALDKYINAKIYEAFESYGVKPSAIK